ncbi:PaaI family thioesterase [Brevibacillus dissolubilis]|uniref:PaaI family thioesterase n=1 Tax=Brevibacillus dissolubilis TaxID=1844116 RepID=UPI001115BAAF|nr:PaaI family thioesterase [Brevibacillus dissolubilis]
MMEEIKDIYENGSDEEREILELTLSAIRQRRERGSSYVSAFLGLSGQFVDEDTYQFIVPITKYMDNNLGMVHGGITATLIDCTMGSLINRQLPPDLVAVTTDLQTRYLRPARGKHVRSEASFIQRGRKIVVIEGRVYDDRDNLVAHGTGTFMLVPRPTRALNK